MKELLQKCVFLALCALLAVGCSHHDDDDYVTSTEEANNNSNTGNTGGTTIGDSGKSGGNKVSSVVSDQYWWGTWQRMDNGALYVINENTVTVKDANDSKTSSLPSYNISASTDTTLTVTRLGSFTKSSDRIMESGNVPYFRQGGTNLEFKLKLVGFENSVSTSARLVGVTPNNRSNAAAKFTTSDYPSYEEERTSDDDGTLTGHAPVAGASMTVEVARPSGGTMAVPGITVTTNGANMGTIPVVDAGQYSLKVTGIIADEDKTDGYLYAGGYKAYPLTLTITNISDIVCPTTWYKIEAEDGSLVTVTATDGDTLEGSYSTMQPGATKTIHLLVTCGNLSSAYVDTALNISLTSGTSANSKTWVDYVPLRFHKGLVPVSFEAVSNGGSKDPALNGFVIYPDNNTKFFAVDQQSARRLYLPSFGSSEKYLFVFSGATTTQQLSDSTEMYYTVALGTATPKSVELPTSQEDFQNYLDYGETGSGNETEATAYAVTDTEFQAFLGSGDKDFYSVSFDDGKIISAGRVPKDYWETSSAEVETVSDETIAGTTTGIIVGTLANSKSWVTYDFYAVAGTYTIEWGDKVNTISDTLGDYSGTARVYVSAASTAAKAQGSYYSTGTSYLAATTSTTSPQTITVSTAGYVYVNVKSWLTVDGGDYTIRVKNAAGTAQDLYYVTSSGYAGFKWTTGEFSSAIDSAVYYFYATAGRTYNLRWSDAWSGFGHSAAIKVSANTSIDFDGVALFTDVTEYGYSEGQTFTATEDGYVFVQVTPQNSVDKYSGNYALLLTYENDKGGNTSQTLYSLNESITSASEVSNWLWGCLYPDGYEIFKVPVIAGTTYSVVWDDSKDGSNSTDYDADVLVSAYAAYSGGTLSSPYWEDADNGYTTINTVTPQADGYVYVKVVSKAADAVAKTFRVSVSRGNFAIADSITEVSSHNCNFEGYTGAAIANNAWSAGHIASASDADVYYFTQAANTVYKIYVDDSYKGSGAYTANTKVYVLDGAVIDSGDTASTPYYTSATSFYRTYTGITYLHVLPNDNGTGTYAITVLDGDNNPVTLTKYTLATGDDLPATAWLTGELTAGTDRIAYRYKTKAHTFFRMFWDDKGQGSGNYTADIEVAVSAPDSNTTVDNVLDDGYALNGWQSSDDSDGIYYFYITPKDASAANIGTYRIAIMEGMEGASADDFKQITPNATLALTAASDITVTKASDGTKLTFSADAGYESYLWYIDGTEQSTTTATFTVDTNGWSAGTYEIELEARKGTLYKSATYFVKVE